MFVSYFEMGTFPKGDVSLEYKFHVRVEALINSKITIGHISLLRRMKETTLT